MRLRHALARAATVLFALPLAAAVAGATPAQAQTYTAEVPGCYGVAVIVCDPAVEIALPVGLQPFTTTIPVCVGTCTDVPVTGYTVVPNENPRACLKTEDRAGNVSRTCVPLGVGPIGLPTVEPCPYGETGAVIRGANGSVLFQFCRDGVLPRYYVEICSGPEVGVRIYDDSGNTVLNFCFVTSTYHAEVCEYPYVGVVVYDQNGNRVAGRCARPVEPTSICDALTPPMDPWIECNIA